MRTKKQMSKGQQILAALRAAYPCGLTSSELMEITPRAQARIGELIQAGWQILSERDGEDGIASYRLSSLVRGEADEVQAGCVIRCGSRSGWQSRTHREAVGGGSIPSAILDQAESAALAAYRGVVEGWQSSQIRLPIQKSALDLFNEI